MLVIVFLSFIVFAWLFHASLHLLPTELYDIKQEAIDDIDFTDIFYQIDSNEKRTNGSTSTDIILINTGSVSRDSSRLALCNIIQKIKSIDSQPRAIGIDMYFVGSEKENYIIPKLDSLIKENKIVIGCNFEDTSIFKSDLKGNVNFGYVNITAEEGKTVRTYFNYFDKPSDENNHSGERIISFARKLYNISENINDRQPLAESFLLKYCTGENGCYNITKDPALQNSEHNFPAIEARDFLKDTIGAFKNSLKNKIVIIGWLGKDSMSNRFDIEDKFRVPVDFHLFNRLPAMSGAVLHANALQQLLDNRKLHEVHPLFFCILFIAVVLLYLYMFLIVLERIRPILLKLLLEIIFLLIASFLITWLAVSLMKVNYHLNPGKILVSIALLIEFKMFACEFYKYLEKQLHTHKSAKQKKITETEIDISITNITVKENE